MTPNKKDNKSFNAVPKHVSHRNDLINNFKFRYEKPLQVKYLGRINSNIILQKFLGKMISFSILILNSVGLGAIV